MVKKTVYSLIVLLFIYLVLGPFTHSLQEGIKQRLVMYSLECSGEKSSWLKEVATYSIKELNYSNLQLSYIDSEGKASICTAGWESIPYVSDEIDDTTTFLYASTTKIFTSELILDLIRRNKLQLNDKLIDFLPYVQVDSLKDSRISEITISDLLSHRAGFDKTISNDTMTSIIPWCPYKVETLESIRLDFNPNSKNVYSNLGYCLLEQVIEQSYSRSYLHISKDYFKFNENINIFFVQPNIDDIPNIPTVNQSKELENFDFFALAAVGGLAGTSNQLSELVHYMDRKSYPSIISRPKDINCDLKQVRGCHGFSGYEYKIEEELTIYWRDGRLPKSSALVIMDSDNGVLALLSSSENGDSWLLDHNHLVDIIYHTYLEERDDI